MDGPRQANFNLSPQQLPTSRQHYEARLASITAEQRQFEMRSRQLSWTRPALFFPAAAILFAGYSQESAPIGTVYFGWGLMLAFVVCLIWHEHVQLHLEKLATAGALYQRLLARLDRNWKAISPLPPITPLHSEIAANYSFDATGDDLDVFGPRSLYQWYCLAGTKIGRQRAADWLSLWVDAKTIESRQEAVRELCDQRDIREKILYQSYLLSFTHASPENFTSWSSGPSWLRQHRIAHLLSFVGPGLLLLAIVLFGIGKVQEQTTYQWTGLAIAAIGLLINIAVMLGRVGPIHDIFQRINTGHQEVRGYQDLYRAIESVQGKSPWIVSHRETCCVGPTSAIQGFARLERLIQFANLQRNFLFYIPYVVLQFLLMLDFRVLELLEKWQRRFGAASAQWLDALADWEALASAATVADENRSWTMPQWTESDPLLTCQAIGHPLLRDDQRVTNDLTITQNKRLLLITGSNMSGKSTLLRSIGLNLILARTGAPMCASSYAGRVFELTTSIRVRDSLQDGVSFFMAELHRLRDVVHATKILQQQIQRPVLVLLDEILQGTNSRERQLAVVEVVKQLLGYQAITMISTHDLELADNTDLLSEGQLVHFREYFEVENGKESMKFDYRMRPGPTPTTNALKLLELVGLRQK